MVVAEFAARILRVVTRPRNYNKDPQRKDRRSSHMRGPAIRHKGCGLGIGRTSLSSESCHAERRTGEIRSRSHSAIAGSHPLLKAEESGWGRPRLDS